MKHSTINGWTKETMKAQILARNNGKRAGDFTSDDETDAPDFICRYRDSSNNACAVGCFIPDSVYASKLEGEHLEAIVKIVGADKMPLDSAGLRAMQQVHDDYESMDDVREELLAWIDFNVI